MLVLEGHIELDAFRRREVHDRFAKELVLPLEVTARSAGFLAKPMFARAWAMREQVARSCAEILRRYPVESGPASLVDQPPLELLPVDRRERLREHAQELYEDATDVSLRCAALAETARVLFADCDDADRLATPAVREDRIRALIPRLRAFGTTLEELPYGVWIP